MPKCGVAERLGDQRPIELGLTDAMAEDEASRCLRCDICIGCGLCELVCSEMGAEALRMVQTGAGRLAFADFERPGTLCLGCGACVQVCPTGAIRVEDRPDGRVTVITGTVVRRQALRVCAGCGRPYAPEHLLQRLEAGAIPGGNAYCPDCTRVQRSNRWAYPVKL
jgi:ferredoxin